MIYDDQYPDLGIPFMPSFMPGEPHVVILFFKPRTFQGSYTAVLDVHSVWSRLKNIYSTWLNRVIFRYDIFRKLEVAMKRMLGLFLVRNERSVDPLETRAEKKSRVQREYTKSKLDNFTVL